MHILLGVLLMAAGGYAWRCWPEPRCQVLAGIAFSLGAMSLAFGLLLVYWLNFRSER